jgi:hypothetical protein
MSIVTLGVYMFFVIFALTAIITLLGIINIVKIRPQFLKPLFTLLILEVVGSVAGYVKDILKTPSDYISKAQIISTQIWNSSYPENGWRTHATFQQTVNGIMFHATTFYVSKTATKKDEPIIIWESVSPIQINEFTKEISFPVVRKWSPNAVSFYPELKNEIEANQGEGERGIVKLTKTIGLRGAFVSDVKNEQWGFMFNEIWQ